MRYSAHPQPPLPSLGEGWGDGLNCENCYITIIIVVRDYRGSIDFSIRRCVEEKIEPLQSVYHDPYEQEFSLEEIRYFVSYFCGYLLGR